MIEAGRGLLILALAAAVFGAGASVYGALQARRDLVDPLSERPRDNPHTPVPRRRRALYRR